MARSLRVLPLLGLTLAPLFAQQGDRPGEVQQPLPDTFKIPPAPILTPEQQLATFKLPPGFKIEAVAVDPLLHDPIAIQFGPDGRLWVLEMTALMNNVDGTGEDRPICDVAVLTDTDGDGRYDKRAVFADNFVMPRALSLVGDGLLVGEPPKLWFLRDTNGDGVADEKKEIASDYGNRTNPEHNANGLMWAMDNWIYSANWTARLRWQGDGKFLRDPTVTRGQWGITQDDYGRIYYNSNSDPLRVDIIPSAYLKRNPNFPAATGVNVQVVPANLKVWPGRVTPGINRGYRTLDNEGKMYAVTAACGPVIYRGDLFPEEFRGDAFIAEPSGNLIKRIKLDDREGGIDGKNAYEGTEFLTSTDERFRPVNLFNGPDGALYVVDLSRGIVQHKIYITSFLRQQIKSRDLDQGLHFGRIWRIVPENAPRAKFTGYFPNQQVATLVGNLNNANGWVRDTAQRLLVESRDPAAATALKNLFTAKTSVTNAVTPFAKLHALWALDGLGAADAATLTIALNDPDAHVAAAAVRLAENFMRGDKPDAALTHQVASLVTKRQEPELRLQLALSLGESKAPVAEEALRTLAVIAGKQMYLADAIVSGLAGREVAFVEALIKNPDAAKQAGDVIRFATSSVLKGGNAADIDRLLALLPAKSTPAWAVNELLAGVRHFLPRAEPQFAGGFGGGGGRGGAGAAGRGGAPGAGGGARGQGGGGRGGRGEGRIFPGNLPAEPKALEQLAADKSAPGAATAAELLPLLKWPGKPGAASTARALTAEEQAQFEKGKAQYATLCAACHQPNGAGLAGLAPPLQYSRWVLGDPSILARIVLNGKAQENMTMPPWKAALSDENLAAVLTYVRRSWGHDADPVTVATVAEARGATAKREEPFSDADLAELLQEMTPARGGRRGGN